MVRRYDADENFKVDASNKMHDYMATVLLNFIDVDEVQQLDSFERPFDL